METLTGIGVTVFLLDNKTNKIKKLYPLMDFNKAFLSYETIEGALCQTTERRISQKQAAIEAVRKIGLNQTKEIERNWFADNETADMFFARFALLKEIDNSK